MDLHTLMILFLAVLLASFLHGISGFAFGIVALMIFPYFFPYTEAIALTSLMMIFVLLYNACLLYTSMFFCSFNERKQVVGLILLYARHKENLVYKRIFYHWGSYVIIANRNV